jgi:hypothetical protein
MLVFIFRAETAAFEVAAGKPPEAEPVVEAEPVRVDEGGFVRVVPNVAVVVGAVEGGRETVDPPEVVEPVPVEVMETVLEDTSAIAKPPVEAKTLLMFPMSTASNVYPSPAGTMGKEMSIEPDSGMTLFAMANALWKTSFLSSREKVAGSPGAVVHETVT